MPMRPIRDIIHSQEVVAVPPSATVREACEAMTFRKTGSVLVIDEGRLVGIFTERDALTRVLAAGRNPERTTVASVMTTNPASIAPDRPVVHALHLMNEGGYRHMPVVEHGTVVGIVSMRDAIGLELCEFEHDQQRKRELSEIMGLG